MSGLMIDYQCPRAGIREAKYCGPDPLGSNQLHLVSTIWLFFLASTVDSAPVSPKATRNFTTRDEMTRAAIGGVANRFLTNASTVDQPPTHSFGDDSPVELCYQLIVTNS